MGKSERAFSYTSTFPAVFTFLCISLILSNCRFLPKVDHTLNQSAAIPASRDDSLNTYSQKALKNASAEESAFLLIADNQEAMDWRLALVDQAESSIDIQTFIWSGDASSGLLFTRIYEAAKRGVRVRILLDDFLLNSNDRDLARISQFPNLEIRIFNPVPVRGTKFGALFYYLTHFDTINRRMHNKSFIVDGVFAVNGGRNIGDHYFGLDENYNFRDLDVLTTGPVLPEIQNKFDRFWNDSQSYPAEKIHRRPREQSFATYEANYERVYPAEKLQSFPRVRQDWTKRWNQLAKRVSYGKATFIGDAPEQKGKRRTVKEVGELSANAKKEIYIVSPYFIPDKNSLLEVKKLIDTGVRVKLLVPSLGANNHTPAHSHYRKYRRAILNAGIELYEYDSQPSEHQRDLADTSPVRAKWIGLHTKAFVYDRETCFIGSLNLDPRAMDINTEAGLIINSPELAQQLAEQIDEMCAPANSWRVMFDHRGRIIWNRGIQNLSWQSARNDGQRTLDAILRWIPIEQQL